MKKGLIYRGKYIVNWCPRCETAISDLEVEHEEVAGQAVARSAIPWSAANEFITVATTRPETMLGDTAVAVNAKDERYTHLHGKNVLLPLMNREIPIITRRTGEPEFGTGAVKVTPAHDPNDFQAGLRHNLPQINVMDEHAHMNAERRPVRRARPLRSAQARARRSAKQQGFLVGEKDYTHRARQVRPLQDRRRAAAFDAVVHQDQAAGRNAPSKSVENGEITHSFPEN